MGFDTAQLEAHIEVPAFAGDTSVLTTNTLDHTGLLTQPLEARVDEREQTIFHDADYTSPGLYAANLQRGGQVFSVGDQELAQVTAPQIKPGLFLQSGSMTGISRVDETEEMSPFMIQLRAHGDTAMAILHSNRASDIDRAAKAFAFVYNSYDFTIRGHEEEAAAAGNTLNEFSALVLQQISGTRVEDPLSTNFEQNAALRQLFRGQLNGILNLLNLIRDEGIDSIDEVVGLGESIRNYLEVLVDSEIFVNEATELSQGFSVMERLTSKLFPNIDVEFLKASIVATDNVEMSGRFYMNLLNMLSGLESFRARNVKVYVELSAEGNAQVSALYDGDGGEFHNPKQYIRMKETTTGTLGETQFPGLLRNGIVDNSMRFILRAKDAKNYAFSARLTKEGIDFVPEQGVNIPRLLQMRIDNSKFMQHVCQFEQMPVAAAYVEP